MTRKSYYDSISSISEPLSKEDEHALMSKYKETGDIRCRDRLMLSNLRLVVLIASAYKGYGVPLEDIISEGNMGLLMAIDHFDLTMGSSLCNYAGFWIKNRIRELLNNQLRMIRVPQRTFLRHKAATGNDEFPRVVCSLNDSSGKDGELESINMVEDTSVVNPSISVGDSDFASIIHGSLMVLTGLERSIIKKAYGIGCLEKSLNEIGKELGASKQRVHQIKVVALEKIRGYLLPYRLLEAA
jgi:RNA polymerase primary sigma factor